MYIKHGTSGGQLGVGTSASLDLCFWYRPTSVFFFFCVSGNTNGRVLRPWPISTQKNLGCSLCLGPYCRKPTWGCCPASARASPTAISKPRDEVTDRGNSPTSQEKSPQTQWRFGLWDLMKNQTILYKLCTQENRCWSPFMFTISYIYFFRYQLSFY